MPKLKYGVYIYKMEVPVEVSYSTRDDGSVSIDLINVPSQSDLYGIVDKEAKNIKAGVEVRAK